LSNSKYAKYFPFLDWISKTSKKSAGADLIAGITGAILVLPQGVAFALIAGLPPIYGLYTAIISPIVAALFGSSKHTVNGPTTAISIVVYSTIQPFAPAQTPEFVQLAIVLTLMTGVIQLVLGLVRMGALVNFVSHTVVVGFTAGAALLIGASQLKYFFGIELENGLGLFEGMAQLFSKIETADALVVTLASVTLILAILIKYFLPKWPHMLIAMVLGSVLALLLNDPNSSIQYVEEMKRGFPPFSIPELNGSMVQKLFTGSLALALLALIQSAAIAKSIALKSGDRIDSNQEFISQGLSNIVGSFFSNYTSGASFTRSALNYLTGAKTPLSAIISAFAVLVILLFAAPYSSFLPIPVMAGIIILVAYKLIDFQEIKKIVRSNNSELVVLVVTFLSTLFLDLEYAIYFGVLVSLVFYLQRTGKPRIIEVAPDNTTKGRSFKNTELFHTTPCPQLAVIRIDGSLFFGAVESVGKYFHELEKNGKLHLLILGDGINFIDLAGAELIYQEYLKRKDIGGGLYFSGLKKTARDFLESSGFTEKIGNEKFFRSKTQAISFIYQNLDRSICETCTVRVFLECSKTF